jgi:hypothetical protein
MMENNLRSKTKAGFVARLTGGSIVLMAVLAMVTFGMLHEALFPLSVTEEVALDHMHSHKLLLTIVGWTLICVLDFVVSWGVYELLKGKNRRMAILSGGLRLVYTVFLCLATSRLVVLFNVIKNETLLQVDVVEMIERIGLEFNGIWQLGLIVFGAHLVVTGIAFMKRFVRMKILFVVLIIGGIGYGITSGLFLLGLRATSLYSVVNGIMMLPMIVGELGLGIWLLAKGNTAFNAT